MSIRPARIRAIVVAILVLAFVIPWTYAHIAYAWPWKEQIHRARPAPADTTSPHTTSNDPCSLGTLSDGRVVYMGSTGEVSMGRENRLLRPVRQHRRLTSTRLHSASAKDLHRGDSTTVEGVGTFTLKEAHSDIVWFTPNPGKATFCFDPDPTFTMNNFAQQGH